MANMKSNNSLVYQVPLFSTLAALLIAVPLRVYQYLKIINPETGFYDKTDFSVFVVYAVLTVAMVICIAFSYIKHKSLQPVNIAVNSKKPYTYLIFSLIMAVGIAVDSLSVLADYLSLLTKNTSYISTSDYVASQGGAIMLIQSVFGLISAIYFIISGITSVNKNTVLKLKFLAVSPVIWCIFRLLFRFKRTISFVNVSDLLLEMFAIVFAMVFFLALAQVNSKIDAQTVFWKLFAYGFPAVMFSLVCFLPRIILVLTDSADKLNELYLPSFSDLTFAVYTTFICITAAKAKAPATEE